MEKEDIEEELYNIKYKKLSHVIYNILKECEESDENRKVTKLAKELIPNRNNLNIYSIYFKDNYKLNDIIFKRFEIPSKYVDIINVQGDGNCFFRCLSLIFFQKEDYHMFFRKYLYDYYIKNYNQVLENYTYIEYNNISYETKDYIPLIKKMQLMLEK